MSTNPPPSVEVVHSTTDKVSTAQALQSIPGVELVGEHTDEDKHKPKDLEEILAELKTTRNGLSSGDAQSRLAEFGPNSIPEKKVNPILVYFSFMNNPFAWAMETAAIIAIILLSYIDFGLITGLLFLNATIAFFEEHSSSKTIEALKSQLAPTSKCMRDGEIKKDTPAADLVPGDVVLLRLGDIVPADAILLEGEGLKLDQSSLTGESLPVQRNTGQEVYSGSIVKQGENLCVVSATGPKTFFGKAAGLLNAAPRQSRFTMVLRNIGWFCIVAITIWVIILLVAQFGIRNKPCPRVDDCPTLLSMLVLIVGGIPIAMPTVLSVTMAIGAGSLAKKKAVVTRLTAVEELSGMDILCSDKTGTLTLGKISVGEVRPYGEGVTQDDVMVAAALASRPENDDPIDIAIDAALTDAQRTQAQGFIPSYFHPFDPVSKKSYAIVSGGGHTFATAKGAPQVILRESINQGVIHEQVDKDINEFAVRGQRALGIARSIDEEGHQWEMIGMLALFDPPREDTKATIERTRGLGIDVKMITGDQVAIAKETARMLGLGTRIHRSSDLDKAASVKGTDVASSASAHASHMKQPPRTPQGGLPPSATPKPAALTPGLPPAGTQAREMTSGKHIQEGMKPAHEAPGGTTHHPNETLAEGEPHHKFHVTDVLAKLPFHKHEDEEKEGDRPRATDPGKLKFVMDTDGFAEVFPEHKYDIVRILQGGNHVVGMTGDGVNDAPALNVADIGIAVAGATGAARSAADIVLLNPGLAVIIDAIVGSRKIFQRMKTYCIYSISVCVRIVCTFGLLAVIWSWYFPPIGIVILAFINDGTMMTISKDRVKPSQGPDKWNMIQIFTFAIVIGLYLTASTIVLFVIEKYTDFFHDAFGLQHLNNHERRGMVYLNVSITGFSSIFAIRSHSWSYFERPGNGLLLAFVFGQAAASVLGAYGLNNYPHTIPFGGAGWAWVLCVWVYSLLWYPPMDIIKFIIYNLTSPKESRNWGQLFFWKRQKKVNPMDPEAPDTKEYTILSRWIVKSPPVEDQRMPAFVNYPMYVPQALRGTQPNPSLYSYTST